MNAEQAALYEEWLAAQFTLVDLNLYLNTHPWDDQALACFNRRAEELADLKRAYEASYGPVNGFGHSMSPGGWRWNESPWPWDIREA